MIAQEREKREAERKARDKRARIVREQQELKEAQEQLARLGQEDKQAAEEEAEKAFQAELLKRAARSRSQELEKKALFAKCNQVGGFSAEFVPLNSSVHQVFEAIDTNSDGSLTRAEVIRGLKTSSNVSPLVPSVCC